jgi:hypothetical protein
VVNLIWDITQGVKTALEGWADLNFLLDLIAFFNTDISINLFGFQLDLLNSPLDILLSPTTWLLFVSLGLVKAFVPAA